MTFFHGWCRVAQLALALVSGLGLLRAQEPPIRIMPLGDSITYGEALTTVEGGYRNRLHTLLSPPTGQFNVDYVGTFSDENNPSLPDVDHQGRPGFRADQVLASLGEWLNLMEDPDVVLLLIGTNDIWQNESVGSTLSDLNNLIGEIATRRPFAKIIVSSLPPRYDGLKNPSKVLYETLQQQYNAGIPAIVANHVTLGHQVSMVDMHSVMTPFDFSSDGVHPSTGGYNKMADVWAPEVNAVITPQGGTNPPLIVRATGMDSLTEVELTFSKPVADNAVNLDNFEISGGISVSAASLDTETKRTITLTTSSQTPGMLYTVMVDGVRDRTPQQNLIAPASKANFLGRTVANGGFENGTSGWTLTGNVEHKSEVLEPDYYASEGEFFLAFNSGQSSPNGEASQTFATTVGHTYNLSFDMGVLAFNTSAQRLRITVQGAGTLVSDITTISRSAPNEPNVRWLPRSYSFVANSSSTTLTFTDVSTTSNALDLLLDKIRLVPANTLAVTSSIGSGINMTITPADLAGAANGVTGIIRSYDPGTPVSVTAPASHLGRNFIKWQRNGIDLPGSGANITVSIDGNQSINAVYEPNSAPLADNPSLETDEDTPLPIVLSGSDVDGDTLIYQVLSGPAHGVLSGDAPNLTYTPAADFHGADSFTFTVSDGIAPPVEGTVSITVVPINDAPVASHPTLQTDEDTPLPIVLSGSDVDGDTLIYQVLSGPAHGVLSGDAPNLTYTPAADFHGADSFTFTVSDGIAPPVEGTVSISVIDVGGTPFDEWAAIHGVDPDPAMDPDGDSVSNAVEYVIGGDPGDGTDGGLLPQGTILMNQPGAEEPQEASIEQFCFTYRMARRVRNDARTQVVVEWCTDPTGPWTVVDGSHGETTDVEEGAVVDLVRVFIPVIPAEGRLFARLRVTISPEP